MLLDYFNAGNLVITENDIAQEGITIEPVWPTVLAEDFCGETLKK